MHKAKSSSRMRTLSAVSCMRWSLASTTSPGRCALCKFRHSKFVWEGPSFDQVYLCMSIVGCIVCLIVFILQRPPHTPNYATPPPLIYPCTLSRTLFPFSLGGSASPESRNKSASSLQGIATAVPWDCNGSAMVVPWQYHGSDMGLREQCHCSAMAVSWQCHGSGMGLPWQCLALPWHCHCTAWHSLRASLGQDACWHRQSEGCGARCILAPPRWEVGGVAARCTVRWLGWGAYGHTSRKKEISFFRLHESL